MSNSALSNFSSPSENQQSPSLFDMYKTAEINVAANGRLSVKRIALN